MLNRVLRGRNCKLVQNNLRYNKYTLAGRPYHVPYAGDTEVRQDEPVGDYYKYIYNADDIPDVGFGHPYPKHSSYGSSAMYAFDNWQYEYQGQWWDIAGIWNGIFYIISPLLIGLLIYHDQVN